jgi:hypothetical protein
MALSDMKTPDEIGDAQASCHRDDPTAATMTGAGIDVSLLMAA